LKSTNFLGLDHIASAEIQLGDEDRYQLFSGRYIVPLGARHQLGGYYVHVDQKLGGTVKSLNIKGKGNIGSAYFSYKLVDDENFILRLNPAFDYKNIENKVLGTVVSKDYMRVAKLGFDLDLMDMFHGRTLITQDFDFGIPNFMGGLKAKDVNASRTGSGGKFFKSVTNLARVQSMPYSASLMLRGGMQLTADKLTSTEQFNIGGITTVRGYPVSEYVGDRGYNAAAELYIPPFFMSKTAKIPVANMKFYDAFRFVGFFDWGRAMNKDPQVGEKKSQQIYSAGPGLRFDIPGKLSVSFDYGFALGQRPTDGSHSQGYIETKLYF
jgi:hemolysin activation/secretion protein